MGLQNNQSRSDRDFLAVLLQNFYMKPVSEMVSNIFKQNHLTSFSEPESMSPKIYIYSDQKACFDHMLSDLWKMRSMNALRGYFQSGGLGFSSRVSIIRSLFRPGVPFYQLAFWIIFTFFLEPAFIILWSVCFIIAVVVRILLQFGFTFPLLSLMWWTAAGKFMRGEETLPCGENGYSKIYHGGQHADCDELEKDLMMRHKEGQVVAERSWPWSSFSFFQVVTICISYKHYATDKEHKICTEDLRALVSFIKQSSKCKIRFWIDAKLPDACGDGSFERWIRRGVRPYGRYITFICPSAERHRESRFWLCNEYYIARCGKGILYFEGDEIYYELRYGCQLSLYHRFLRLMLQADEESVRVRDEDREKMVKWAIYCFHSKTRPLFSSSSPIIDKLDMEGKLDVHKSLYKIRQVVRKFGDQELPVIEGKSWNKLNPLILKHAPSLDVDYSSWLGLCDNEPKLIYFIHSFLVAMLNEDVTLVLAVYLDKPYFSKEKKFVVRKVLKEVDTTILKRSKITTLSKLCDWH